MDEENVRVCQYTCGFRFEGKASGYASAFLHQCNNVLPQVQLYNSDFEEGEALVQELLESGHRMLEVSPEPASCLGVRISCSKPIMLALFF